MTALVLGSGGAKGWTHIGVIKRLLELNIKPDLIVGSSIGAIMGAFLASGKFDILIQKITDLSITEIKDLILDFKIPNRGFLRGDRIHKWLSQSDVLGNIKFTDLKIPLIVTGTNMFSDKSTVLFSDKHTFKNKTEFFKDASTELFTDEPVTNALRVSYSIPGIFEPVKKNNMILVDGGIANQLPTNIAKAFGATKIIAVDLNLSLDLQNDAGLFAILFQTIDFTKKQISDLTHELYPADILIAPDVKHIGTLSLNDGHDIIKIGYDCACKVLNDNNI